MYELSTDGIKISENDQQRSDFVCNLVQTIQSSYHFTKKLNNTIPKIIVQYWDNPNCIPHDVQECIDTWNRLNVIGCKHLLFNDHSARRFIAERFSQDHIKAYDCCYHPAMKSDYFRLCFILSAGGCYIDADDAYNGTNVEYLFNDNRLKLQPLCFDISTGTMIESNKFTKSEKNSNNWIFYFNNNPLVASPGDNIIGYALQRATHILIESDQSKLPEIQSTTGPGNLTASIVAHAASCNSYNYQERLLVLFDWGTYASTVWPLSYRNDKRNWRLSNRQHFLQGPKER